MNCCVVILLPLWTLSSAPHNILGEATGEQGWLNAGCPDQEPCPHSSHSLFPAFFLLYPLSEGGKVLNTSRETSRLGFTLKCVRHVRISAGIPWRSGSNGFLSCPVHSAYLQFWVQFSCQPLLLPAQGVFDAVTAVSDVTTAAATQHNFQTRQSSCFLSAVVTELKLVAMEGLCMFGMRAEVSFGKHLAFW